VQTSPSKRELRTEDETRAQRAPRESTSTASKPQRTWSTMVLQSCINLRPGCLGAAGDMEDVSSESMHTEWRGSKAQSSEDNGESAEHASHRNQCPQKRHYHIFRQVRADEIDGVLLRRIVLAGLENRR